MESPFFRNHWNYPQNPRYVPTIVEVPVQRRMKPAGPKVVSIPVRFVESEKNKSDSITKIQKVIRGFLVRKSVKKVTAIKREVDEIERKLADEETIESIRNDAKERLKYGEMLMSLLLKLDAVKGVDSGVRDFRKAVIKKAIALQEKVDSIVEAGDSERGAKSDEHCAEFESREDESEENPDLKNRINEEENEKSDEHRAEIESLKDESEENPDLENRINEEENEDSSAGKISNSYDLLEEETDTYAGDKTTKEAADCCDELRNASRTDNIGATMADSMLSSEVPAIDHNSAKLGVTELREEIGDEDMVNRAIESVEMSEAESETDSSANPPNLDENAAAEERESDVKEDDHVEQEEEQKKLLEKMMEDNKKMMEMMGKLFQRNEIQTRLLSYLAKRVEHLEKAFLCTRKKKRSNADASEKTPKTKKFDQ